jgi:hypothetical protein
LTQEFWLGVIRGDGHWSAPFVCPDRNVTLPPRSTLVPRTLLYVIMRTRSARRYPSFHERLSVPVVPCPVCPG